MAKLKIGSAVSEVSEITLDNMPISPIRTVSGTVDIDEDKVVFAVGDVDIFMSFTLENKTKSGKICFTHPEFTWNEAITSIVGYMMDGYDTPVLNGLVSYDPTEGDYEVLLNEPDYEGNFRSRFKLSILKTRFGNNAVVESGDELTLTYYHTDCPYIFNEA